MHVDAFLEIGDPGPSGFEAQRGTDLSKEPWKSRGLQPGITPAAHGAVYGTVEEKPTGVW